KVQLNLTHASESSSNDSNTKELAALQKERTIRSEANFFGSIQSGVDVAIYMGHARSGGGPDFSPPRLLRSGLPDYAFYRREKNGIRRLLKSLDNSLFPPAVVGLLACKSTQLFVSKIEKQVPNSLIVSAGDLFDYNDIVPTGFALLDSLLAEKCSSFFSESVRVRPLSADFLHFSRLP
ncbi:MAG: hypothetical protein KDD35_05370, partial [Bdellovibrionales bacterium]|nr:hypothetical protein [Bdellovibrionales bacterium]